jgi:hypothetical protein
MKGKSGIAIDCRTAERKVVGDSTRENVISGTIDATGTGAP